VVATTIILHSLVIEKQVNDIVFYLDTHGIALGLPMENLIRFIIYENGRLTPLNAL